MVAALVALPALAAPGQAAAAQATTYQGTLNGANYLVEVPQNWNGTLLLWSHAAYLFGFQGPPTVELANRPADQLLTEPIPALDATAKALEP